MANVPDLLCDGDLSPRNKTAFIQNDITSCDNIANALASESTPSNSNSNTDAPSSQPQQHRSWTVGLMGAARDAVSRSGSLTQNVSSILTNSSNAASSLSTNIGQNVNLQPFHSLTKSISNNITGRNTLPDKTTASQVLMFRQLLHTKCRPGLRLSRGYEGTAAQIAVLHMPWWERGIEQSKKMIISYDNLITRLWLSGAIMPYEKGGYALNPSSLQETVEAGNDSSGSIDTLINERGLPPVPHQYWVDRLGFQQDDPVTDFRSGGVLSLAMLVHIVESCPAVHARFVPKQPLGGGDLTSVSNNDSMQSMSLEQIMMEDAAVLPFGITCINITDMLAKFLMFSKSVDKMDALLSAKPFWKMFIDPNAMLVLQEVSLDLLCDVCVEIGRERRLAQFGDVGSKKGVKSFGMSNGKVTVFDFSEIMKRTEERVGDEVLGAGPQTVDELRAIARRVKSKYLMRIQLKEKHQTTNQTTNSPTVKQLSLISESLPSEAMKNVTNSVLGGVGGFVSMWKASTPEPRAKESRQNFSNDQNVSSNQESQAIQEGEEVEVQYIKNVLSQPVETEELPQPPEQDIFSSEAKEISELSEAFDLLGGDFSGDIEYSDQELLGAMGTKLDPSAAFTIDGDDFRV